MRSQLIDTQDTGTNRQGSTAANTRPTIPVGMRVELRSRFDDRWTHGFAIAVCGHEEYQVRRLSDGHVLPAWFPASMLRPVVED